MDSEIAWEDCVDDLPLDTKNLPSLNALSSNNSSQLPDIDLLDLFSFDSSDPRSPRLDTDKSRLSTPPLSLLDSVIDDSLSPVTSSSPAPSSPTRSGSTDNELNLDNNNNNNNHNHNNHSQSSNSAVGGTFHCSSSLDHPFNIDLDSGCDVQFDRPQDDVNAGGNHEEKSCPKGESSGNEKSNVKDEVAPSSGLTDQAQLVLELSTRLASAGAEATALRKRVAALSAENRSLRNALDHANARLVAVAQAASSTAQPPSSSPVMLGLAHVTSDVASRFANVLTVADGANVAHHAPSGSLYTNAPPPAGVVASCATDDSPRERKKRKRVTGAATTMACVMFMWGALVGSPGWLSSSSSSRSQANLPAVWKGDGPGAVANVAVHNSMRPAGAWQPNCMRVLEQLPDAPSTPTTMSRSDAEGDDTMEDDEGKRTNTVSAKSEPLIISSNQESTHKNELTDGEEGGNGSLDSLPTDNKMFVDVEDKKAARAVAHADVHDPRHPRYSYVLCRDAHMAMENVKSCTSRMKKGLPCGEPHTISLILPASVAGLSDEDDNNDTVAGHAALAEVQCSITSVGRIPGATPVASGGRAGDDAHPYGRVIATVAETGTVIADH